MVLSSSLTVINNNITNLNQDFITELINYIYQNISQKINQVDVNLIMSKELLNYIVDSMNNILSAENITSPIIESALVIY